MNPLCVNQGNDIETVPNIDDTLQHTLKETLFLNLLKKIFLISLFVDKNEQLP